MLDILQNSYAPYLAETGKVMLSEVEHLNWEFAPQMKDLVLGYLTRTGKRLRPLMLFIFNDLFSGNIARTCCAAASIETYHTATLIYDDIQDNSEFRRGLPCAHITASTSMAMNQAGVIRSLMYHMLYRCHKLSAEEKLAVHQHIDKATTLVSLGQSIDIGWHEGWYTTYRDFPYAAMIAQKTAALFGCAAAIGAYLARATQREIDVAEQMGTEIGSLFQTVDDYLDVFGDPVLMGRPLNDDLREGKITAPVLCLFNELAERGDLATIEKIIFELDQRDKTRTDWEWVSDLMLCYKVDQILLTQFTGRVHHILAQTERLGNNPTARQNLQYLLQTILSGAQANTKTATANST